MEIILSGETLFLLPQRAVYRPAKKQLILADVHLGKAAHFRKEGMPLPEASHLKDLDKLHYLLKKYEPKTVLILGDLFHSAYNKEWMWFKSLLLMHRDIHFVLVEGNHDILDNIHYEIPNLHKERFAEDETFIFTHAPLKMSHKVNVCGHIHPGIKISGQARQSEKFACFVSNKIRFILPAFGYLTGLQILRPENASEYFLIAGTRVVRWTQKK